MNNTAAGASPVERTVRPGAEARHTECATVCQQSEAYGVWPEHSCSPSCAWLKRTPPDDGADLLQEPVAENLERCAACGEVFDIEDHAPEDDDYDDYEPPPPPRSSTGHEWDDDAVCIHCGFDGAEWHHWKHHTYEGKAQPEAKPPLCTRRA